MSKQYITTAIDYPNAAPHMGHVLEKVLADVMARWARLNGQDVRFQIGTDEHGIKIQQTAKRAGKQPKEFVEGNRQIFIDLYGRLNISHDEFMHTSGNPKHTAAVQELWKRLANATHADGSPVLEKRDYTALYCSGCERFITKKELVDGKCPDHQIVPEEVTEQNWFFTLSKDADYLKGLLQKAYRIIPDFRAPETLNLLEAGLEDVSFSRPRSSLSWGIPVPGDEDQTMYVWCDALTNYISGFDYFVDAKARENWWEGKDVRITHVIGKDIARFHALIWPAMLHHAGIRVPDELLIHGFLTSEGQKMSKSLGNVVVPQDVLDKYGVDPLRYYLSHEIPVGNDGDFSWKRFGEIYDAKLRNQLGNLLNRILVLLKKDGGGLEVGVSTFMDPKAWATYDKAMEHFELSVAIQTASAVAGHCDKYMNDQAPWKAEPAARKAILSVLAENMRHIVLMLLPFIPETAQTMARQLGLPNAEQMQDRNFVITKEMKDWGGQSDWKQVGEPSILFPPVEKKLEA